MQLSDFVFLRQGKIVKLLEPQDAHYLAAIDQHLTPNHERALLLLHGFSSSPAVYRAILPLIRGYDRILCPILPGHSESIEAFGQASVQQWRNTAREACEQLLAHYSQVSVVGLSLGGALALELSQTLPLEHLFLLAPALKLHYSAFLAYWAVKGLARVGTKSLVNLGGDIRAPQFPELTYRRLPLAAIEEVLSLVHSQTYSQPHCPTDLFLGRHDAVVDVQTIANHYINQPNITLHWLANSAHILPLDQNRAEIVDAINRLA